MTRNYAKKIKLSIYISNGSCGNSHFPCYRRSSTGKCIDCETIYKKRKLELQRIRRSTKEGMAKTAEYLARPEVILYRKQWSKEYQADPIIAKHRYDLEKQRRMRPEVQLAMKETQLKYRSIPKNISRIREYSIRYAKEHRAENLARAINRQLAKIQRTPKWANKEKIKKVYLEAALLTAETGIKYHVDHIVPLRGKLVSGLHVENNLRAIPAKENMRKHNTLIEELL